MRTSPLSVARIVCDYSPRPDVKTRVFLRAASTSTCPSEPGGVGASSLLCRSVTDHPHACGGTMHPSAAHVVTWIGEPPAFDDDIRVVWSAILERGVVAEVEIAAAVADGLF